MICPRFWPQAPRALSARRALAWLVICALVLGSPLQAAWRITVIGDSISHGGVGYASYRYSLHQQLTGAGYAVNFTGLQEATNGGDDGPGGTTPTSAWYPNYYTTFDRRHSAFWGWRSDQVLAIVDEIAEAARPNIALIHLGTNDIRQNGAAGVTDAVANLTDIVAGLRVVNPDVIVLLAQIIPYTNGNNKLQIPVLNTELANLATTLTTPNSPILLVDQNSGFDTATMLHDGLHPNLAGETQMANVWVAALAPIVSAPHPPAPVGAPPTAAQLSFEDPILTDGLEAPGPGEVGGWNFVNESNAFVGIYNPLDDTYTGASGDSTPLGGDGANVASLTRKAGGDNEISATIELGSYLQEDRIYTVTVAVGARLSSTQYFQKPFGGYRIELLADEVVLGTETDSFVPAQGSFQDATLQVSSLGIDPGLLGEPLSVRISQTSPDTNKALDVDHVRVLETLVTNYATWTQAWGLTGPDALETADPDNDGLSNRDEFAFRLPPLTFAKLHAAPDTDRGTPTATVTPGGLLEYHYVRRKASTMPGLAYAPEFTDDLVNATWAADPGATTTVGDLGDVWERVTVHTTFSLATSQRCYGRIELSNTP